MIDKSAANFCLASGRMFNPFTAKPADIFLEDIATGLANIGRFGGHTTNHSFYSVAEHSVLVSRLVEYMIGNRPEALAAALLHDASEALGLGDMISPVKRCFPEYIAAEHRLMQVIFDSFGLPREEDPVIKLADQMALSAEQLAFQPDVPWLRDAIKSRNHPGLPDGIKIFGMRPVDARARFMDLAFKLGLTDL